MILDLRGLLTLTRVGSSKGRELEFRASSVCLQSLEKAGVACNWSGLS